MIEITGASLVEVVKAAYDLSSPQGMGFIHATEGPMSDEDAEELLGAYSKHQIGKEVFSMDYVRGRAVKLTVFMDGERRFIRDAWFDHTDAHLEKLLEKIGVKV